MASNFDAALRAVRLAADLRVFAIAICLLMLPQAGRAANNCPWMTGATASGLLGGDAVGTFTEPAGTQPAVCLFTYEGMGSRRTLRITVEVTPDTHARVAAAAQSCGSDAEPLKAIGNEAIGCSADDRRSQRAVGRVRDQFFTITIGAAAKGDTVLTREALQAKIYTAAEQVAGNLF